MRLFKLSAVVTRALSITECFTANAILGSKTKTQNRFQGQRWNVKSHQNLITSRDIITYISTKLWHNNVLLRLHLLCTATAILRSSYRPSVSTSARHVYSPSSARVTFLMSRPSDAFSYRPPASTDGKCKIYALYTLLTSSNCLSVSTNNETKTKQIA